jgi:hypothetical protein
VLEFLAAAAEAWVVSAYLCGFARADGGGCGLTSLLAWLLLGLASPVASLAAVAGGRCGPAGLRRGGLGLRGLRARARSFGFGSHEEHVKHHKLRDLGL